MPDLPPSNGFDDHDLPRRRLPWPLRLGVAVLRVGTGLFVTIVALFCFAVALVKVLFDHDHGLGLIGGVIFGVTSLWALTLGVRLVFNRRSYGGLLPLWFFRLFAVYLVSFPIFLIVTQQDVSWPWWRYLLAGVMILSGMSYWGLAAYRKASHLRA
jgi:hypothetical protein